MKIFHLTGVDSYVKCDSQGDLEAREHQLIISEQELLDRQHEMKVACVCEVQHTVAVEL
jgi:hypothetical protein